MFKIRRLVALISLFLAACFVAPAQQNASPMVEHTREHPRLTKTVPPGRRLPLELGSLFVPEKATQKHPVKLLLFFHGGD